MEGLNVIEKSYTSLQKFKETILSEAFSTVATININMKNYDMKTQAGLKAAIGTVLEVYKDELSDEKPISKILTGDIINIKIINNDFRDDLVDSLRCYIEKRAPELWITITNNNAMGGLFSV